MLCMAIGVSAVGYLGIHALLRSEELKLVWEMLRKKLAESRLIEVTHATSDRLQVTMGLDGRFRNDTGIDVVVFAEVLAASRADRVAIARDRLVGRPHFSTTTGGTGTINRLSGRETEVLRPATGPHKGNELPAEGLADPLPCLLWPASILSVVAVRIGGSEYARAVGNAVGANPMPIVIPCHRIVSEDKSLADSQAA